MPEIFGKNIRSRKMDQQNAVEKMWLHYYNHTLLVQGLITQSQYRSMNVLINGRATSNLEP